MVAQLPSIVLTTHFKNKETQVWQLLNDNVLTQAGVVAASLTGIVDLDRHHYYDQSGTTVNAAIV